MFFRAALLFSLPSLFLVGGWVLYDSFCPSSPFAYAQPLPPTTSSYSRQGVTKEINLAAGGHLKVGCQEAFLTLSPKNQGGWSEKWIGVVGEWVSLEKNRKFSADEAKFYFSSRRLEARHLSLSEEGFFHLVAGKGEFSFTPGAPTFLLDGGIVGDGVVNEEPFQFESPSLMYEQDRVTTAGGHLLKSPKGNFTGAGPLEITRGKKTVLHQVGGGILRTADGWSFPFDGDLYFDGDLVQIPSGNIKGESDLFTLEGHSLEAVVSQGRISDLKIGQGVVFQHRLVKEGESIQEGRADQLDLKIGKKEGLMSGKGEERAHFVDRTHGVEMEVEALYFRWNDKGGIDAVDGIGEMTVSTLKGEK